MVWKILFLILIAIYVAAFLPAYVKEIFGMIKNNTKENTEENNKFRIYFAVSSASFVVLLLGFILDKVLGLKAEQETNSDQLIIAFSMFLLYRYGTKMIDLYIEIHAKNASTNTRKDS